MVGMRMMLSAAYRYILGKKSPEKNGPYLANVPKAPPIGLPSMDTGIKVACIRWYLLFGGVLQELRRRRRRDLCSIHCAGSRAQIPGKNTLSHAATRIG